MKIIIVVSLVCYLGGASAKTSLGTTVAPAAKCRQKVTLSVANCTTSGLDAQIEQSCLLDSVIDYMLCQQPKRIQPLLGSLGSVNVTMMPMDNIKCFVTTSLDLIECVIEGELKTPFVWDWTALTKCLVSYIPAYLTCIPK